MIFPPNGSCDSCTDLMAVEGPYFGSAYTKNHSSLSSSTSGALEPGNSFGVASYPKLKRDVACHPKMQATIAKGLIFKF